MNEPRRLREVSGSAVEHALLSAGASYRSSAEAHAKTLGALGLASSAALSAGVASAAAPSLISKLGWTKILSLLSVGVAVVAPVTYLILRDAPPPPGAPSVRVAAATVLPARAAEPAAPVSEQSVQVPLAAGDDATRATRAVAGRVQKSDVQKSDAKADSVAAELGVIDAARTALARGDAAGALTRLEGYARTYPRGRLALEAEVLRIDALARSGQAALASRRAESFLRRHPNSVLASRVRGYLRPAAAQ